MNGKQARKLRQKARMTLAAQQTTYVKAVYNKSYFDVLTGTLKGYKVYTATMDLCQRSVYKELKVEYVKTKGS